MKNILLGLCLVFAFNSLPVAYPDEPLPEIAPVDEPAIPPLTVDTSAQE